MVLMQPLRLSPDEIIGIGDEFVVILEIIILDGFDQSQTCCLIDVLHVLRILAGIIVILDQAVD
jgi:hypothetical protein